MPETTMRQMKKYFDWRSWFEGMYVNAIKSSTSAFLAFAGTNTAEAMAPAALSNLGLNWQQALGAGVSMLIIEVVRYVNAKPLPETVEVQETK